MLDRLRLLLGGAGLATLHLGGARPALASLYTERMLADAAASPRLRTLIFSPRR